LICSPLPTLQATPALAWRQKSYGFRPEHFRVATELYSGLVLMIYVDCRKLFSISSSIE
jgi:hypothetical protein